MQDPNFSHSPPDDVEDRSAGSPFGAIIYAVIVLLIGGLGLGAIYYGFVVAPQRKANEIQESKPPITQFVIKDSILVNARTTWNYEVALDLSKVVSIRQRNTDGIPLSSVQLQNAQYELTIVEPDYETLVGLWTSYKEASK